MLITIDVGNSNIVAGVYRSAELVHRFRLWTHHYKTADEFGMMLCQMLQKKDIKVAEIEAIVVCSVVPQIDRIISLACQLYLDKDPRFVPKDIPVPLTYRVDRPAEVGADLVVNAYAGWKLHEEDLIIVDLGTATTFQAVTKNGEFLGVAIAPGIEIASDALFSSAAKLPRVELKSPQSSIGKNTKDAIQSGIFLGYVGLIDSLVMRMRADMGTRAKVVATGGLAKVFMGACKNLDEEDADLTLKGLRMIYRDHGVL